MIVEVVKSSGSPLKCARHFIHCVVFWYALLRGVWLGAANKKKSMLSCCALFHLCKANPWDFQLKAVIDDNDG